MAKFKTKVVVLSVEHREEDNRIVTFSPIDAKGNANVTNNLRVVCNGEKGDNFEEGEVYSLTIEKVDAKKDAAPATPAAKTPPATPPTK